MKSKNYIRKILIILIFTVSTITISSQFGYNNSTNFITRDVSAVSEIKSDSEINLNTTEFEISSKPINSLNVRNLERDFFSLPSTLNIDTDLKDNTVSEEYINLEIKIDNSDKKKDITAIARPEEIPPTDKYTNVLVMGLNGGLTDTLIVLNINETNQIVTTISIPRDFWDSRFKEKINRIYIKHGLHALLDSIESLLGIEINNHLISDFQGFEKIIDHLGGIWIYNPKDIEDKKYPTNDYKYQIFKLNSGYHKLDGKTSLKFARTRHTDNDFMRARRQQEVINGTFNAFKALQITDINKILNIIRELIGFTKTDLAIFDILGYLGQYNQFQIKTGNVLEVPTHLYPDRNFYGEFILMPRDPSLKHIHDYVNNIIK
jgi:LCP family protein required for cell wall assembly